MHKRLYFILILLLITASNIFAGTSNSLENNSTVLLESNVGFSTNTLITKFNGNTSYSDSRLRKEGVSLGRKATFYRSSNVSLATSATFTFTSDANLVFKNSELYGEKESIDLLDSDFWQNSINLFIGIEKYEDLNKNFSVSIAVGPNYFYSFEKEDLKSYYSYGIAGFADISYKITPTTIINFGINAFYDPFINGKFFQNEYTWKEDLSYYNYSITHTIGFCYSV